MTTGAEQLTCVEVDRFVDAYLDGEFAGEDRVAFDGHLTTCEACRKKTRRQVEWKQAIRAAVPREKTPSEVRARVKRALAAEPIPLPTWRRWAVRTLPAAAAAGIIATIAVSKVPWSPVAADAVSTHQRNLPVEVTGQADQVKRWYVDKVGFPVRPPTFNKSPLTVALRGGRLSHIRDREAAELLFDVNGSKVSAFIFDVGDLPMRSQHMEHIGNRDVYFDEERGYNVAMYRDNGVGYAIVSDLDRSQMVNLVSAAVGR